jgi:hypothetical protein
MISNFYKNINKNNSLLLGIWNENGFTSQSRDTFFKEYWKKLN